jgi:hypothetical protein
VYVDLNDACDAEESRGRRANMPRGPRGEDRLSNLQRYLPANAHDVLEEHVAQLAASWHQNAQKRNNFEQGGTTKKMANADEMVVRSSENSYQDRQIN